MEFKKNLFDLSSEEETASKEMYSGKIIKCLVAPYHSYKELEKIVPYTSTTYLFPEREMSVAQVRGLISMIVASSTTNEIRIITTSQNVIMDMIDTSVRVLTEGGDIVASPTKTFMANIHDIRYNLLENDAHRLSESEKNAGVNIINELVERVNDETPISREDFDKLIEEIDQIGEPIIGERLKDMAHDKEIVG